PKSFFLFDVCVCNDVATREASTRGASAATSDVYKSQALDCLLNCLREAALNDKPCTGLCGF
ncbi:hypothetical protein, partial [Pseudomonas peli]|uniref:hypothetical protein n=1 Tax=Pseudomonas peli TaxID=592361 RepID=UPI003D31FBA4